MITTTFAGFPGGPCGGGWGGTSRPDLINPAYAAVQILQKLKAGTRLTRTISGGTVPDGYEALGVKFTSTPKRAFALIVNDTYAHHNTPTVTFTNLPSGMGWGNGTALRKFVQRIDDRSYPDGVGLEAPYSLGGGTVSGGSISVSLPTTDVMNGVQTGCLCSAPAHSVRLVWWRYRSTGKGATADPTRLSGSGFAFVGVGDSVPEGLGG
jgi:hypothetical protein